MTVQDLNVKNLHILCTIYLNSYKGGPHMAKQTKSLTHFSELTSSELHHISGGDLWNDLIIRFPWVKRITGDNSKHKIG